MVDTYPHNWLSQEEPRDYRKDIKQIDDGLIGIQITKENAKDISKIWEALKSVPAPKKGVVWHTHIQVCQIPLTKLQEPQVLTRSKTATLFELDCILHRAAKLTDRNFTIILPSDEEGNLLLDESIDHYKEEIIKTINQIKTEEL